MKIIHFAGQFRRTVCRSSILRIMKLTVAILIIGLTQVSAAINAQITIKEKNIPLQTALKTISHQSGYDFIYSDQVFKDAHPISLNLSNASIETALNLCFKDQPLTYRIEDKTVMVRRKIISDTKTVANNIANVPQAHDVLIHVTDSTGQPLSGASVLVKGTKQGGSTDAQGNITLAGVTGDEILAISFSGYESQEISIGNRSSIIVLLRQSTNILDETQVIAYGTTTRRFSTGNISTVKAEDIEKQPVSNPLLALEGRVSGMMITQQTGVPGGAISVQLRGQNSIANGNDPLYIVDGVPYPSQLLTNLGGSNSTITMGGSPMNFINTPDIERIEVLKDADATAIYGSKGANGVVIITTKKGAKGKTKLNINLYSGIGKVPKMLSLLGTGQYLQMRKEAFTNDGATPTPTAYGGADLLVWDSTRHTDWQKVLIGGNAIYTDAQASALGGGMQTQYLIGGSYHKESTVFPGDFSDQKGSIHFNIANQSLNRKFNITLNGSYVNNNGNLLNTDLTSNIYLAPNSPNIYNKDGSLNWENSTWQNPFSELTRKLKSNTNNLIGNIILSYKVLKNLELKVTGGYTNIQTNEILTLPTGYFDPAITNISGSASFSNNTMQSLIVEPQANYSYILGKGHISILLGSTYQQTINQGYLINASGYTSDLLLESIKSAPAISIASETNNHYRYAALFSRINYQWNQKYIMNLTARRDGSSRFGPDKRFANFGAVGAAWIFSEERYIRTILPFLSFGKFRFSYGNSGNDQIGDYKYLDLYTPVQYPYQGTSGILPNSLFSPDLAWERNKKLEGGLELGFFKDRMLLSGSYYRNRSSNQLMGYTLPSFIGFYSILRNLPALVENKGWELELNTINITNTNFSWKSSANITIPRNKLLKFPNYTGSSYVIGEPITAQKVYSYLKVDPESGVYQFNDSKGNPTINPSSATDLIDLVNTAPAFFGGLQNSIKYRKLSIDIMFQFVSQKGLNPSVNFPNLAGRVNTSILQNDYNDRWSQPGDHATIQKFSQSFSSKAYTAYTLITRSNYAYVDASFIRLKNVSISYQLPKEWIKKLKMNNCRFFLQGQNLITFTDYDGLDPENQSMTHLPPLRVLTAGIDLEF